MHKRQFKGRCRPMLMAWGLLLAWHVQAETGLLTRGPEATRLDNGTVRIAFTLATATDVRVDVLDAGSNVVRHVGAGMLGGFAPQPFQSGTLSQTLGWDGADDAGEPATGAPFSVRISAGTQPVFERVIGRNPGWLAPIHALAVGPNGEVFVYWDGGISVLDRHGVYRRQIAPAPAGMPASRLQGLKPVRLPDGSVYFSDAYQWPGKKQYVGSMAITPQGQLLLPSPGPYPRRLARIGLDGSVGQDAFDTRLTRLPDVGYLYLASDPQGKYLYMAGAEAGYRGDDARESVWRQAVYRLRLDAGGPAEIWIGDDENWSAKPGVLVNRPKGVATDARGNVYVCNYGGNTIAVYSPGGGLLRSISIKHPLQVAVHPRSDALYVLAGESLGHRLYGYNFEPTLLNARLVRLDAKGNESAALPLDPPYARPGPTRPGGSFQLRFAADFTEEKAVLWLGVAFPQPRQCAWTLLRIEETDDGFGAPAEPHPWPEAALTGPPVHLVLDRRRDILYVHDGAGKPHQSRLLRFKGDGRPLPPLLLRNADGAGDPWFFSELAVGPDGDLYALAWQGLWKGIKNTRLNRFAPDGRRRPWNDNPDGALLVKAFKGSRGDSSRGLTVAPNGEIYALYYDRDRPDATRQAWEIGWDLSTAVARFSSEGHLLDKRHIAYLRSSAQGVRVDRAGHVYVGETMRPLGVALPEALAQAMPDPFARPAIGLLEDGRFDPALRFMGSVVKFDPAGGRVDSLPEVKPAEASMPRPQGDVWRPAPEIQWTLQNNQRLRVSGAQWQFFGFSPIPNEYQGVTHVERCTCRGGRFDLDEYGRLFVPDNLRHRVSLLDGAGNVIARFGAYGNADSEGPEIGLADPWWVAAAADRVFVGDGYARRIVKVRLTSKAEVVCPVPGN